MGKMNTWNKWNVFAHNMADSYLAAGAIVSAIDRAGDFKEDEAEKKMGQLGLLGSGNGNYNPTIRHAALKELFENKAVDTSARGNVLKRDHLLRAAGAFSEAYEDDKRYCIGRVVQGCPKDGFATVVLGAGSV